MASGWQVVLEQERPDALADGTAGKALLYYQRQIDELAERLGVPLLSGYFSRPTADIAAYLRSQGVEPNPDDLPEEGWFDSADGLRTVRGLLDAIRQDSSLVPQADKVVADLEGVEQVLVRAEIQGLRFHLGRELPTLS